MSTMSQKSSFPQSLRSLLFSTLVSVFLLTSCSFDKEEVLYGDENLTNCDTVGVSYAADIKPIIDAQCLSCHSLAIATNGVVLEQYSDIQPWAQSGILVGVVEYDSTIKMPQTGKLPLCDIAKIRSWVRDGALEN